MGIRIKSKSDVVRYTLLITAVSVFVPVFCVWLALSPIRKAQPEIFQAIVAMAIFEPLLIAPPIAAILLHIVRVMNDSVERIDEHVKFDGLTGLLNRGHFLDSLRASPSDGMLLIIDADHFKEINDAHGHDAGDEALRALAEVMARTVGGAGIVGRLGGEEFGVFLPGFDTRSGAAMGERICRNVRECPFVAGGEPLSLTISVGGTLHGDSLPIGHSLKAADERLYEAKHQGRDRYVGPPAQRKVAAQLARVG